MSYNIKMGRKGFLRIKSIPSVFAMGYAFFIGRSRIAREIYRDIADEVTERILSGKILDVGTGPGFLPILIAKKAPEIEISGIDLSEGMVKLARKNAMKVDLSERIKFFKANALSMPFENDYFDFVISTFSFHHWLKPVDCLEEIIRVLKKGGGAWIYDIRKDTSKEAEAQFKEKYGFFFYTLLNFVKFHSSVTIEKIEEVLNRNIGFSQKIIEDRGILIKIKLIK